MLLRNPPFSVTLFLGFCFNLYSQIDLQAADASNATILSASQRDTAEKITRAATHTDFAHRRLAELCDTFGPRLSGTTNLEAAIDWVLAEMKKDGLANVRGEPVQVPHWVRGAESLELLQPRGESLPLLGLGGSVATPPEGITAPVLVVESVDELKHRAAEAKDKIVLFNLRFTTYGETVGIRMTGATEAARVGARASLIRSITPFALRTPHTGMMLYADGVAKIPHAAIAPEDADRLQRWQQRGQTPVARLKMNARFLPDATSRNVIAELPGRENPDEFVVLGGHIDSWDVGQGALDDGGGCLAAWEAVRILHELGLQPRRTIRLVLWTNEENGGRGSAAYAATHKSELPNHLLGIETDSGATTPVGFAFSGSASATEQIRAIAGLLRPLAADKITDHAGGADLQPLKASGVPIMDLSVDNSKYFWFHHTDADTVDKVDARELSQCAAALAVMAYVVADAPEKLPR